MTDDKTFVPLEEFERRRKGARKDKPPPSSDAARLLDEIAGMSPAEYGRRREVIAKKTGTPLAFLDAEWKERRKRAKTEADSECDFLADPEPWPDPVYGSQLLDKIAATARAHLVLPSGAPETIALWVLFTHAHDCFQISPLLTITSPTPECGKTTLLTMLGRLFPAHCHPQT